MHSGLSLVSVLLVAALMSGLSITALHLTQTMSFVGGSSLANLDELLMIHEIQMLVNNPTACRASFEGRQFPSDSNEVTVSLRKRTDLSARFEERMTVGRITIDELKLVKDPPPPTASHPSPFEVMNLKLVFSKKQGPGKTLSKTEEISVPLVVTEDVVRGCYLPITDRGDLENVLAVCLEDPTQCPGLRETLCRTLGGQIQQDGRCFMPTMPTTTPTTTPAPDTPQRETAQASEPEEQNAPVDPVVSVGPDTQGGTPDALSLGKYARFCRSKGGESHDILGEADYGSGHRPTIGHHCVFSVGNKQIAFYSDDGAKLTADCGAGHGNINVAKRILRERYGLGPNYNDQDRIQRAARIHFGRDCNVELEK